MGQYVQEGRRDLIETVVTVNKARIELAIPKDVDFAQIRAASEEYNRDLNYGSIATIFRGSCIIRARFLQNIKGAYDRDLA